MASLDWGTTMIIGLGDEILTLYVGCGKIVGCPSERWGEYEHT
jgi:hypothetical protein